MLTTARTTTILYCDQWTDTVARYAATLGLTVTHRTDWFVEASLGDTAHLSLADAALTSIPAGHGAGITLRLAGPWSPDSPRGAQRPRDLRHRHRPAMGHRLCRVPRPRGQPHRTLEPHDMSTPDLDTVGQIAEMVRRFYGDVDRDDLLGPVFNDVARVDWDDHLPKLTAFWARALLGIEGYTGNPFARHATVHSVAPLSTDHFARWLTLFEHTLDAGWAGPNTDRARTLARNVARVHAGQLGVVDSLEDPKA